MKRMIASIVCCIVLFCVAGYIIQMMLKLDTTFLLQAGAVFLPAYIIAVCLSNENVSKRAPKK